MELRRAPASSLLLGTRGRGSGKEGVRAVSAMEAAGGLLIAGREEEVGAW